MPAAKSAPSPSAPSSEERGAGWLHRVFDVIFRFTRPRRMRLFAAEMQPTAATRVLDVGGAPLNWQFLGCRPPVTLLNILPPESPHDESGQFTFVQADACQLAYADNAFDLAYSNSVIEHVGTWENQQKFAAQVRRVARQVWVQTPARECPLEPHYLTPMVHWLPANWRRKLLRNASVWGWLTRPSQAQVDAMVAEIRLLTKREMRQLFPDCRIVTERLLWVIPKSYIAVRK